MAAFLKFWLSSSGRKIGTEWIILYKKKYNLYEASQAEVSQNLALKTAQYRGGALIMAKWADTGHTVNSFRGRSEWTFLDEG